MKLFISFGAVLFLLGACLLAQGNNAKMEMQVPKDMLVWRFGTTYETTLQYGFVAHDLSYRGTAKNKPVSGKGDNVIFYIGILKYNTQLLSADSTAQQGKALRYYEMCRVQNLLGDVSLRFSPGFLGTAAHSTHKLKGSWLDWLSFSYPGEDTAYVVTGKGADGAVICKFKREFLEREAAPSFDLMEYIPGLQNQALVLGWDTPAGARSGTLNISCARQVGDCWVETGDAPPLVIRDLINRETSMLYGAVYDGHQRRANETWELDGKVLGGLIHPSLKAGFSGRVVVQASSQYQSHPPIERFGGDTPERYNASESEFPRRRKGRARGTQPLIWSTIVMPRMEGNARWTWTLAKVESLAIFGSIRTDNWSVMRSLNARMCLTEV